VNGERRPYQDATDIVRAVEQAGHLRAGPAEVVAKLRQIQLGWPAQREFMALSIWMGQCALIHPLDSEGQFPESSREEYRVPDLFAVYRAEGNQEVAVLIEVKSTQGVPPLSGAGGKYMSPRRGKLDFGERYYTGLRRYADRVGLPLLVAWKVGRLGLWLLFDIRAMQRVRTAHVAEAPQIGTHDLTGVLLGNVFSEVAAGSRWVVEIAKLQATSTASFVGRVERSALVSPTGQEYSGTAPLFWVLAACESEVEVAESDGRIVQSIYVPFDCGVIGSRLLDMAVRGFSKRKVEWLTVIRDGTFQWSYADLQRALVEGGALGFIKHVIHPYPSTIPDFLTGKLKHE